MSDHLTHDPTRPRRRARRLPLSLIALAAAAAFVVLLSPSVARTDECMSGPASTSTGDDPNCGGELLPPPPPPPPPGGGGGGAGSCSGVAILYQHANYQGQCWGFQAGQIAYVGDAANDQASSIWVADGYVATLFADGSFSSSFENTVTAADPWGWGGVGNDSVSSLVVQGSALDSTYYSGASETAAPEATGVSSTVAGSSGCAKVGAAVSHRNTYRRLWRYALVTRFCWNGITITAVWEREVAVNIDSIAWPFSLIQGWRYTPVAFQSGEAGYSSTVLRADGRFDYCGFRYGCITTQQPWVRIELYRNGKALCMTSARTQVFACERVS